LGQSGKSVSSISRDYPIAGGNIVYIWHISGGKNYEKSGGPMGTVPPIVKGGGENLKIASIQAYHYKK